MNSVDSVFLAMCALLIALVLFGWYFIIRVVCSTFFGINFRDSTLGKLMKFVTWSLVIFAGIVFFSRG